MTVKRSIIRITVPPVGRCRVLEENESGLRFQRNKIWRFTACTTPYNRPSCKPGAIFSAICRRDIAGVSNCCLKLVATLARQKLHRVPAAKIACVNGPLERCPAYREST